MKQPRITLLAIASLLAACGQQGAETYPPQYELNFMRACLAQNPAEGVCPCTWEKIEREVPVDDFTSFESLPPNEQAAHPLRSQIERFAVECVAESQSGADDPPPP